MASIQIIVNDENLDLPLGVEENIYLTLQINDLANLNNRNASYTSQINIPKTANNIKALGLERSGYGFTPIFKGSRNPSTTMAAHIVMNGITILTGGRLTIESNNGKEYQGVLYFGNYEVFDLITGTIDQLQWGDFDMTWDPAGVAAIKNETEGVVFALATWFQQKGLEDITASEVWSTHHDINFSGFHIYTKTIIEKIVEEVGYTLDDSAVTKDLWDELALACPVPTFLGLPEPDNPIEAEWNAGGVIQNISNTTGSTQTYVVTFSTLVTDADALFDNANDEWDIDRTANISHGVHTMSGSFSKDNPSQYAAFRREKRPSGSSTWINLHQYTVYTQTYSFATGGPTQVESGDSLRYTVTLFNNCSISISGNRTTYLVDAGSVPNPSSTLIYINEHIPKIKKTEFLIWVFNMFNVFMSSDALGRTVTLKPFDDITTSDEQDLSNNLDISRGIDQAFSMPYFRINSFKYADNDKLRRADTTGTYEFVNESLPKEGDLIKIGFGASDGAQRKGIYIRGAAVAEYPSIEMESIRVEGLTNSAASAAFTIANEGVEFTAGDYIDFSPSGEIRQITARTSPTAGTVNVAFDAAHSGVDFTLRKFTRADLTPPRVARIVATQGNYSALQGTEDVTTNISGKEAVFTDALLWSNIITNEYSNLMGALAKPLILKAWMRFETAELVTLDFLKPAYLAQYSSLFYINKINQYKSNGLCQVELVRIF